MSQATGTAAENAPHFDIQYRIRNQFVDRTPPRRITVEAAPDEVEFLVREGYLIRERLFQGEQLQYLRDAADEIERIHRERGQAPGVQKGFGGLFVRNLIEEHAGLRDLFLSYAPLLSVARAVIGPQVQIHASVLRVAYPDLENQAVEWHFHQRVMPDPIPAFFYRPAVLDNLIYLDDLTDDSGPLVVLPKSHNRNEDLPTLDFSDKPGQVKVTAPAGSVVTSHSSLWHKALAPTPAGGKRRLLILGFSPTWLKQIDHPTRTREWVKAMPDASEELRELVGLSGYY